MAKEGLNIREENLGDIPGIRAVNERAFDRPNEANLADVLRKDHACILSLVASQGEKIIGHIVFSPVRIESEKGRYFGAGLGPVAVLPDDQRKGIGTRLIEEGLRPLKKKDCPRVVVLGHPGYYPRLGFISASRYGLRCEFKVPDEVFMVLVLTGRSALPGHGIVKFNPEFGKV
jgi:putative acetyltransferase